VDALAAQAMSFGELKDLLGVDRLLARDPRAS
jgi:hypothetical protein